MSVHPLLCGVGYGVMCCHLVLRVRAQVATARHSGVRKCHSRNTAQAPFRNFLAGFGVFLGDLLIWRDDLRFYISKLLVVLRCANESRRLFSELQLGYEKSLN